MVGLLSRRTRARVACACRRTPRPAPHAKSAAVSPAVLISPLTSSRRRDSRSARWRCQAGTVASAKATNAPPGGFAIWTKASASHNRAQPRRSHHQRIWLPGRTGGRHPPPICAPPCSLRSVPMIAGCALAQNPRATRSLLFPFPLDFHLDISPRLAGYSARVSPRGPRR